jgi:hypothetical protein
MQPIGYQTTLRSFGIVVDGCVATEPKRGGLLSDLVRALADGVVRGLDFLAAFAAENADESPYRVLLPAVTSTISARVAPFARFIMAITSVGAKERFWIGRFRSATRSMRRMRAGLYRKRLSVDLVFERLTLRATPLRYRVSPHAHRRQSAAPDFDRYSGIATKTPR